MAIDNWLSALVQQDHSHVDGDLEALAIPSHPFLTDQCAVNQIECLSGHLGGLKRMVRRQVISYSLYIRQLDVILDSGPRSVCAGGCPRPPVGCCNADHYVMFSSLDLMSAQRSPLALHMGHVIGTLQKLESAHSLKQGQKLKPGPGYCQCLAEDGCTMRLFKSPRCAHYLCGTIRQAMQDQQEGDAAPFLAAMSDTIGSPVTSTLGFMNPDVISEAAALYGSLLA